MLDRDGIGWEHSIGMVECGPSKFLGLFVLSGRLDHALILLTKHSSLHPFGGTFLTLNNTNE